MNGRAYDYNLGRFLSVDPVIQSPGNSQSLNPYSYIMNNPLAGTDPTGYRSKKLGSNIYTDDENIHKQGDIKSSDAIESMTIGKDFVTLQSDNGSVTVSNLRPSQTQSMVDKLGLGEVAKNKNTSGDAKFVDDFISSYVNHIAESSDYSKPSVQSEVPDEVRDALIVMSGTKTGRALMEYFIKNGTTLDLVDTTLSRTLKDKNLSGAFAAAYGEDSEFRDTVYYTRDLEGFRSVVRKNNPYMLDSVINSMSLDVGLVMELGHTRAGNQFGVDGVNTYTEVVPHSLVENRYRAERGLPIRRSYHRKDDMFEYMNKSN